MTEKITKNKFRKIAALHGCIAVYSGKERRIFLQKKYPIDINLLINQKYHAKAK